MHETSWVKLLVYCFITTVNFFLRCMCVNWGGGGGAEFLQIGWALFPYRPLDPNCCTILTDILELHTTDLLFSVSHKMTFYRASCKKPAKEHDSRQLRKGWNSWYVYAYYWNAPDHCATGN